ncbi:hypothetical protein KAI87_07985, partial [Myxococcota bacterium]|nr:hypothetical protein [Myxococcota bacterium]
MFAVKIHADYKSAIPGKAGVHMRKKAGADIRKKAGAASSAPTDVLRFLGCSHRNKTSHRLQKITYDFKILPLVHR